MSNSLQPYGLQLARLPCPPLSPGVCSKSRPLSQWRYLTITTPFHCCEGRDPYLFLYVFICLSVICWRDFSFPIELSWHLPWKLISRKCFASELWILIQLIHVYPYTSATVFIIILLLFWNCDICVLQLCSFSRLFWLLYIPWIFHMNFWIPC